MGLVLKKAGEGVFLTMTDIYKALIPDGANYPAVRKNIEALEKIDMVERRRSGRVTYVIPLERGYDWFRPER